MVMFWPGVVGSVGNRKWPELDKQQMVQCPGNVNIKAIRRPYQIYGIWRYLYLRGLWEGVLQVIPSGAGDIITRMCETE